MLKKTSKNIAKELVMCLLNEGSGGVLSEIIKELAGNSKPVPQLDVDSSITAGEEDIEPIRPRKTKVSPSNSLRKVQDY